VSDADCQPTTHGRGIRDHQQHYASVRGGGAAQMVVLFVGEEGGGHHSGILSGCR